MLGALFNPRGTLDAGAFWSALLFLVIAGGFLALLQQERPEQANFAAFAGLFLKFPFFCVFAQRFRAKGQPAALALIPLGAGFAVALAAFFAAQFVVMTPVMIELAQDRGHDVETFVELAAIVQTDEGFEAALEERVTDPEVTALLVSRSAGPSFVGFWAPAFLLAIWAGAAVRRPYS